MNTTTVGLQRAMSLMGSDTWDQGPIADVYLPASIAAELLKARGWTIDPQGRHHSPVGDFWTWEKSEALTMALVAEAV